MWILSETAKVNQVGFKCISLWVGHSNGSIQFEFHEKLLHTKPINYISIIFLLYSIIFHIYCVFNSTICTY